MDMGIKKNTHKGSSSLGMVIIAFFIFIVVILPLVLNLMEINACRGTKERLRNAAELATSEMVLELDPLSLSKGELLFQDSFKKAYLECINEKINLLNEQEKVAFLHMEVIHTEVGLGLLVRFKAMYLPKFVHYDFYRRYLEVEYIYEFPVI